MTREMLRKLVADPVVRAYTAISGSDVAEMIAQLDAIDTLVAEYRRSPGLVTAVSVAEDLEHILGVPLV